jgi:4-amino-4-deoxy-L-arabinose transferase-like glycosyltransferase
MKNSALRASDDKLPQFDHPCVFAQRHMRLLAPSIDEKSSLLQSSPKTLLAFAVLLLAGVGLRMHDLGRSLWSDEAWVANSVLSDTWSGMFHYPAWLQTTPPLFLVLVRVTVKIFGLSNYTLRAVPFALSVLALILFADLCCRIFSKPLALLATVILATSPVAIVASKELKQYGGDLAAAVIVLFVIWNYWEKADRRAWRLLWASFAVALALSYTTIFFIPSAVAALLLRPVDSTVSYSEKVKRLFSFVAMIFAISGLEYSLLIRPNRSVQLQHFWSHGFPAGGIAQIAHFYVREFILTGMFYFLPERWIHPIFDQTPQWLLAIAMVMVMVVFALLAIAVTRTTRYVQIAVLAAIPMFTLGLLNLARLYPINFLRLTLFILPCIVIALMLGLEIIWRTLLAPISPRWIRDRRFSAASILALAILLAPMTIRNWADYEKEDAQSAILYLKSHVPADGLVYVHASAGETSKLYLRMLGWEPRSLVYGHTGYPCCSRGHESDTLAPDDDRFKQDFDDVIRKAGASNLWLVFTGREEQWLYLHRNEGLILTERLKEVGCKSQRRVDFDNEVVYEYECNR